LSVKEVIFEFTHINITIGIGIGSLSVKFAISEFTNINITAGIIYSLNILSIRNTY
jgi:hypothetical protein